MNSRGASPLNRRIAADRTYILYSAEYVFGRYRKRARVFPQLFPFLDYARSFLTVIVAVVRARGRFVKYSAARDRRIRFTTRLGAV